MGPPDGVAGFAGPPGGWGGWREVRFELPEALGRRWHNRGYHGTLHHDVRAVFHKEPGL
ncbi:hypothetical protein KSE_37090 [Kitasatospora setae KM-6054]|uniref:Alkyl sulfatase dimerisation domain-containing protein n=1 Tax=Kitasatospora setae (strain ATCC 33774 / DSM 43861 / JCM 3304 / KCC A-0304 / NBRC 14216 / KM-6054) TaxID=452652 RepID=E4NE80_KITSK|nr:hypothetical protein KSE_37090 [Kitasatospora setae KM-6054]